MCLNVHLYVDRHMPKCACRKIMEQLSGVSWLFSHGCGDYIQAQVSHGKHFLPLRHQSHHVTFLNIIYNMGLLINNIKILMSVSVITCTWNNNLKYFELKNKLFFLIMYWLIHRLNLSDKGWRIIYYILSTLKLLFIFLRVRVTENTRQLLTLG